MNNIVKTWHPIAGKYDPCTPVPEKTFVLPPQLFIEYQPVEEPQFKPGEALKAGTIWPNLLNPYEPKKFV